MRYCGNCGSLLRDGAVFCGNCGFSCDESALLRGEALRDTEKHSKIAECIKKNKFLCGIAVFNILAKILMLIPPLFLDYYDYDFGLLIGIIVWEAVSGLYLGGLLYVLKADCFSRSFRLVYLTPQLLIVITAVGYPMLTAAPIGEYISGYANEISVLIIACLFSLFVGRKKIKKKQISSFVLFQIMCFLHITAHMAAVWIIPRNAFEYLMYLTMELWLIIVAQVIFGGCLIKSSDNMNRRK